MERDRTKDDLQRQIEENERSIKTRSDALRHETKSAGRTTQDTIQDNALKIGGGAAGVAGLLALLKSLGSSSDDDAPRRPLSRAYAHRLTTDLERRLAEDDDTSFIEALTSTLRNEAPVTLYDPEAASSSAGSSILKTLLTLGALAAAGYGLNLLAKQQTGKDAATLAQEQYEQYASDGESRHADGDRAPTHRAAGAGSANVQPAPYAALEEDFRTHHRTTFGDGDHAYDEVEPAYRHGLEYATREERRNHDYETLEPEIRQTYEERHGENSFGSVGDAARHAFEQGRAHPTHEGSAVDGPAGSDHTASGNPGSAMREDVSGEESSSR